MAQMIAKPQSVPTWDRAIAGPAAAIRAARAFVARVGWPLLLWRLIWAPWWLCANRPLPDLPTRAGALPADLDAPGRRVAGTLDRLRGRIQLAWLLACFVRGLALGVLVAIAWLLLAIGFGTPRPMPVAVAVTGGALALAGIVFAALSRPSRAQLARMLDRTYLLNERLSTAVESLERPSVSPFGRQIDTVQRADAANQLAILHPNVTRGSLVPWRELGFLLTGLALLGALAFGTARASSVPNAESGVVPAFVPASDRLASLPQNQAAPMNGPMPQLDKGAGNAMLGDLNQLGNALDKNPSTQPAAKAIQAGNYPQAASSLQSSATSADQMSPDARNALANQLDRAADQMSGQNQDLQNSTRKAANGLRQGGEQAQQGMNDLANSVNQAAGQTPQPAQAGKSPAQPSQGAPAGSADQQQQPGTDQGQPNSQGGQNAQTQSGEQQPQQAGNGNQAQPGTSPDQQTGAQQSGAQAGENQGTQQGNGAETQQGQNGDQSTSQGQAPGQGASADHPEENTGAMPGPAVSQPNQPQTGQPNSGSSAGSDSANQPNGNTGNQPPDQSSNQTANSEPQQGKAAKPPANGGASSGKDQQGPQNAGSESVALGGTSDQMVQTGQDPASSNQGAGANAGAAQGNAQQGTVGPSGPDSNRVPAGYRGIVSDYFDNNQP